jgi:hypothetical protein
MTRIKMGKMTYPFSKICDKMPPFLETLLNKYDFSPSFLVR